MRDRKLKVAGGHLMSPKQRLYNGLARPVDYSIFAREWIPRLSASLCWDRNGLTRKDSVLAYGHRGWHALADLYTVHL